MLNEKPIPESMRAPVDADLVADGDTLVIDAQVVAPQGEPCAACGAPVEPMDKFCPACGLPHRQSGDEPAVPQEADQNHFRCESCGSEIGTDPDQRSYVCPFCDSTYVVDIPAGRGDRQRPEFVIGFAVTPDQAREKFEQWIKQSSWIRPGDLRRARITDKLKGVYLPFWSFSMLADSHWEAQIGEYWHRTETYVTRNSDGKMVTRTRQVQETEWWPLRGRHHRYHSGYLVSGSKGLTQSDADRIKPFQLPAMKRYEPYYLAGWISQEYSVRQEDALLVCKREFHNRERSNVAGFLPGDTHQSLTVNTHFSHVNSDLCLLPIYILSYRYKDKLYRFLVNGQTGKVAGDKPLSKVRIGLAIGAGIMLVLLVVLIMALLLGR